METSAARGRESLVSPPNLRGGRTSIQSQVSERLDDGANGSLRRANGTAMIVVVARERPSYQVRPSRRSSASRRERPTGSRTPPFNCTS